MHHYAAYIQHTPAQVSPGGILLLPHLTIRWLLAATRVKAQLAAVVMESRHIVATRVAYQLGALGTGGGEPQLQLNVLKQGMHNLRSFLEGAFVVQVVPACLASIPLSYAVLMTTIAHELPSPLERQLVLQVGGVGDAGTAR